MRTKSNGFSLMSQWLSHGYRALLSPLGRGSNPANSITCNRINSPPPNFLFFILGYYRIYVIDI